MNEIFKIHQKEELSGINCISARELYKRLEVKTQFTKWWQRNLAAGFKENIDYLLVSQKRLTNNKKNPETICLEAFISLDMAKQICMLQKTDMGKQFRQYFIECEKRLQEAKNKALSVPVVSSLPEKSENVPGVIMYGKTQINYINRNGVYFFRLSDIKPLMCFIKQTFKFIPDSDIIKVHNPKNNRFSYYAKDSALYDVLRCFPKRVFCIWFCELFRKMKKQGQLLLEFKKDETKKVSLEIKNDSLKEEIKSFLDVLEQERKTKTFDILTRYKSFSLQDLQTVQAFVLNERKNELYQDVLSFCNQKAITISDFLTLSEKLNNTLLSI